MCAEVETIVIDPDGELACYLYRIMRLQEEGKDLDSLIVELRCYFSPSGYFYRICTQLLGRHLDYWEGENE